MKNHSEIVCVCGFSSPSIISLLYNRMTKFLLRAPKMGFCQQIKAVAKWKPQHQPSAREPESEREREMRWDGKKLLLHLMGIYVQNKQNFIWMSSHFYIYIKLFLVFHFTCALSGDIIFWVWCKIVPKPKNAGKCFSVCVVLWMVAICRMGAFRIRPKNPTRHHTRLKHEWC